MGHPVEAVFGYTPKRIAGFLHFARLRKARDAAESLQLAALAARGDPKDIKKAVKDLGSG
jgi:hypothetical protein